MGSFGQILLNFRCHLYPSDSSSYSAKLLHFWGYITLFVEGNRHNIRLLGLKVFP